MPRGIRLPAWQPYKLMSHFYRVEAAHAITRDISNLQGAVFS